MRYLFSFLVSISIYSYFSQAPYLDSINLIIKNSNSDSVILESLSSKSDYFRSHYEPEKAAMQTRKMIDMSLKLGDINNLVSSKTKHAINLFYSNKEHEAFNLLFNILDKFSKSDSLNFSIINISIGNLYQLQKKYSEALEYYFQGLIFQENNKNILSLYMKIRDCYTELNDKDEALFYNFKVINLSKKKKEAYVLAHAYLVQGYLYLIKENYKESYRYSILAKNIFLNELKNPMFRELSVVYGNIADVYIYCYQKEKYNEIENINPLFKTLSNKKKSLIDTASYYISKSYKIANYNQEPYQLFYANFSYGNLYFYQGKLRKAESYYLKSYEISSVNKWMLFDHEKISESLYEVYKKLGNDKKALKYHEEYVELNDTLFNEDKQRELGKQEAKFEFDKQKVKEDAQRRKKRAIEEVKLEKEKAVTREKEKKQRLVIAFIAVGLIVISVFTLLILKRLKVARSQQNLIEAQKETIEKNRNQMLESIEYSKNIQERIFPTLKKVKRLLPNSFIYFRPKDVVSGDFFWAHKKDNKTYFSVADCTGHGVPGAFMTLISLNLFNAIILEEAINSPSEILERLNIKLKESLTSSEEDQMKHGLDIAMCAFNHDTNQLEYSGVHNPIYIINKDNELLEIKGDKLFLGISTNFKVTQHVIAIKPGDSVYMSTDGFPDQKGGEKGKKYYYSRLRNTLREVDSKPLDKREQLLDQKFNDWKGDKEQIDDVCIMGVSF